MQSPAIPSSRLKQALLLQQLLLSLAEGDRLDNNVYTQLRTELLDSGIKRSLMPRYVREFRNEGQLWDYFKKIGFDKGISQEIRKHICESFEPLIEELENRGDIPEGLFILGGFSYVDLDAIHLTWPSAIRIASQDPETAITCAHTLLEMVCKQILDESGEKYGRRHDFLKLYVRTSWVLNLSPSQDTEDTVRAMLGSCQSVVHNLGIFCGKCSDSQRTGHSSEKPSPRHATLAVNLAWTVSAFLLATWKEKQGKGNGLRAGNVERIL